MHEITHEVTTRTLARTPDAADSSPAEIEALARRELQRILAERDLPLTSADRTQIAREAAHVIAGTPPR